jgi:hypothetical protein
VTTTATGSYVCDNSTLTNFKSWAQAISNAFSAFGWTQTADTGQVNWSSIASVPSSTYVYEVWKASDALASTMPIYVKIGYGASSTSPRIQITVGTSSNGSGTITGQAMTGTPWTITGTSFSNGGATTYPCYFSGSTGEFRMWMWGNPTGSPGYGTLFVIERGKDGSGANTADYVTALYACQFSSSTAGQQTITASGVGNLENGVLGLALTSGSGTGLAFGTVTALPVFPVLGKVGNPMLGLMTAVVADAAINSTVTVTSMYGSTHTYIAAGGNSLSSGIGGRAVNGAPINGLMRYE